MLRKDARPLYVKTAEELERWIEERALRPGARLPSEASLADQLGVSRSTIREALRDLELRGRIDRRHGLGTMVAAGTPIVTGLTVLESLESLAARQGWRCGTEQVRVVESALPDDVAPLLGLAPGELAVYLTRVKTRDWRAVAFMETWLPASVMTADTVRGRFESSITDLLLDTPGLEVELAVAQVSAAAASGDLARMLGVPEGSPLVLLNELFFHGADRPLCYSQNSFVPDAVKLEVRRHPAPRGHS
jgi:GntR family transcriptional regulator